MIPQAHILVYVSSATAVPLREGGQHPTGIFLGELTEVLQPLLGAGHRFTFVSPDGRPPHIDENSHKLLYWGFSRRRREHAVTVYEQLKELGLAEPLPLSEVMGKLDSYDALFIPGGHAPMTDILYENWLESESINQETGELLLHFHLFQKPSVLICHAPAALAAAPSIDGRWIYAGYRMTCVSMLAEWMTEDAPLLSVMKGHLKDYPTHLLRCKGAAIDQTSMPMASNVVEDRELLTGQDSYSAEELGRRFAAKLFSYKEQKTVLRPTVDGGR